MDLELVRLDLRYQELRTRSADREKRLLASLASLGQQTCALRGIVITQIAAS